MFNPTITIGDWSFHGESRLTFSVGVHTKNTTVLLFPSISGLTRIVQGRRKRARVQNMLDRTYRTYLARRAAVVLVRGAEGGCLELQQLQEDIKEAQVTLGKNMEAMTAVHNREKRMQEEYEEVLQEIERVSAVVLAAKHIARWEEE